MEDLPRETLENVATFLAKPSRALLAVAMPEPSSFRRRLIEVRRPSTTSLAVLGITSRNEHLTEDDWSVLDFGEIEESLATKLTDDDVCRVLRAIDAVNNLKRLNLSGCVNITGMGMEPLYNSTVLEQIDLGLIRPKKSPALRQEPLMSQDAVLPILTSIVGHDGSSLKYIMLPKNWRSNPNEDLTEFVGFYDQSIGQRLRCSVCERFLSATMRQVFWHPDRQPIYGLQFGTCAKCLKSFCINCLNWRCDVCEHVICGNCTDHDIPCMVCGEKSCWDCKGPRLNICHICHRISCKGCYRTCGCCRRVGCSECLEMQICDNEDCGKCHCAECFDDQVHDVTTCDDTWRGCGKKFCQKCRFLECSKNWSEACQYCFAMVGQTKLSELSAENAKLSKEVAKLREENERLRKDGAQKEATLKEIKWLCEGNRKIKR
ncbi:hypothetical protein ACHAWF_000930 [Thalassiosira exigua]